MRGLEFFCGAGGVSRGLAQSGHFDLLVGIDIRGACRKHYPKSKCSDRTAHHFVQADVLVVLEALVQVGEWVAPDGTVIRMKDFDFIWASPPCQKWTALNAKKAASKKHKDLITPTRMGLERLRKQYGIAYAIENVEGAPLRNPTIMCGAQFDLHCKTSDGEKFHLDRKRLIEASFPIKQLPVTEPKPVVGVYGGHIRNRSALHGGRGTVDFPGEDKVKLAQQAMGIPGMPLSHLSQAIPPAYAKYVADQWMLS